MDEALLTVKDLKKYYPIKKGVFQRIAGYVRAVDGVSLEIPQGKTVGLVGESGSGKSTFGETVIRLLEPDSGEIIFEGENITKIPRQEMRRVRSNMQIVFQDPHTSLNPRMHVKDIVGEPLKINRIHQGAELNAIVLKLLEDVGLKAEHLQRYPHEFSGGQKQRIAIARALAVTPSFIVLDEPTSALDVSVQAQVLNLLKELQQNHHLTYLFISHDLSIVKHISDSIAVVYVGKMMEFTPGQQLFAEPLSPYTKALLSAIPVPDPTYQRMDEIVLSGDVPNPSDPPSGCRFHPRCPDKIGGICEEKTPILREAKNGHWVACHLY